MHGETPAARPNVQIVAVTIYPPGSPPLEIPASRFRDSVPGLVIVCEEDGTLTNYYNVPYKISYRAGAVLAPGPRLAI